MHDKKQNVDVNILVSEKYGYKNFSLTHMIVFMTDGEANEGLTGKQEIVDHVRQLMTSKGLRKCSIHSLAFGEDADYALLQLLSSSNSGLRPDRVLTTDCVTKQKTNNFSVISHKKLYNYTIASA